MLGDVLPIEVMARREQWSYGISIYMRQVTQGVACAFAKPIEFEAAALDFQVAQPAMILGIQQAQQLMDELWQCGLRPSEGSGSTGSLAATERHLKDMQRLVFKDVEDRK